jgi:hypothetical protein
VIGSPIEAKLQSPRGARMDLGIAFTQSAGEPSKPANVLTHSIPHPFRPLQLFPELLVLAQAV